MYIEELHYINIGPIERADMTLLDATEEEPHPVVLVGKNGSGKSILLSNMVDCFFEIARLNYNNVVQYREDGGYLYYKIISKQQIQLGKDEMFSYIKFRQDTESFEYIYKQSSISKQQFTDKYGITLSKALSWEDGNAKAVTIPKDKGTNVFDKDIVCYFAPNRFAKPIWLGEPYLSRIDQDRYSVRSNYTGTLRNPIEHVSETKELLQWIFDVLTDARPEIIRNENRNN